MPYVAVVGVEDAFLSSIGAFTDSFVIARRQIAATFEKRGGMRMATEVRILTRDGGPLRLADNRALTADAAFDETTEYGFVHVPAFRIGNAEALAARMAEAKPLSRWLARQHARGAIISASGSGVFFLAEAELLGQGPACVPRPLSQIFRRRYPQVRLDQRRAIVEQDRVLCSRGVASDFRLMTRAFELVMTPQMSGWLASVTALEPLDDDLVTDDPLIAEAQVWLGNRFNENVRIADLAKALSVSHQTLIRHFHRRLGTTPMGYVQRLRAQSAQAMLRTSNRSIDQIARLTGYNDTRTFRTMFREQVGMSASRYRAAARAGAT